LKSKKKEGMFELLRSLIKKGGRRLVEDGDDYRPKQAKIKEWVKQKRMQ